MFDRWKRTAWSAACGMALVALGSLAAGAADPVVPIEAADRCADEAARDQDDMCIWMHPSDPALSTIIAADKAAHRLFVYDLSGKTIQSLALRRPGNIDLRYGFAVGKSRWDVVAVNLRSDRQIAVLGVDPATRRLQRLDDGDIETGENYGGTLYRSAATGRLFFITTSYGGQVEQHELLDNGQGGIQGKLRRTWKLGLCEAAVADDQRDCIYIAEEQKGVWELCGKLGDQTPPKLVIKLGDNGLKGDVEGLAIYPLAEGGGYLLVSNQGSNNFKVYRRDAKAFVGTFAIAGARQTDGLDVCHRALGDRFPGGLFACHSDGGGQCPIILVRWERIAASFDKPLEMHTDAERRSSQRK